MQPLEFRLLGSLEARRGDEPLPLGGRKQRALLALLLLEANRVVSRDRLVDGLWGSAPPDTALTALQVYVSHLRHVLEPERRPGDPGRVLVTRPPGYLLSVESDLLDLARFERLAADGARELGRGHPREAARALREALALWRGRPLGDLADEPFALVTIARLEELRLTAVEERVDADIALGRHLELVPELRTLVTGNPYRERLRAQLIVALYRCGRQADALDAYREAHEHLARELGIQPSRELQQLQRRVLTQDPELDLAEPAAARAPRTHRHRTPSRRSILVVPTDDAAADSLLRAVEPLALAEPPSEVVLARILASSEGAEALADASGRMLTRREHLLARGVEARVAAFRSSSWADDVARLASTQEAQLLVLDAALGGLDDALTAGELGALLVQAVCDVALILGNVGEGTSGRPVLVPFAGGEHDWAALELGAWAARALGARLRLAGPSDAGPSGRDASRLLADASLVVQRLSGVPAEPALVDAEPAALAALARDAALVVGGLSERWRLEGLGPARTAFAEQVPTPLLYVRRGVRPGGLAPPESFTRFTWSFAG